MPALSTLIDIPEAERTPLVSSLLELLHQQSELIGQLKDEIAKLKGNPPRPKIKPSGLAKQDGSGSRKKPKKRRRSGKRHKKEALQIDETITVPAVDLPSHCEFKGYKRFVVQGIKIHSYNVEYLLERWRLPDGTYQDASLPKGVSGHFSAELICFILYQYYQCHVTQPLLREQLLEYGIDVSAGQLSRLLIDGNESLHAEKAQLLSTALAISPYVQVDDTGARHKGKNGVCTHIGNELFAWFKSTRFKNRINFLELLNAANTAYSVTEVGLDYMIQQGLPAPPRKLLTEHRQKQFSDKACWEAHLADLGITQTRHRRIATEGALIGNLFAGGLNPKLVILSDDAGQFNVLLHALCWVHAERLIYKLVGFNDQQREAVDSVRDQIWKLYARLKAYKNNPNETKKYALENRFDKIFQQRTCFETLNGALKRLHKNRAELLLVLDRPEIPLHNNASESDIREQVKRRKISGGTRSDLGQQSRDTFISVKKTCRKLGISFWAYLLDRVSMTNQIKPLPDLMREKALTLPGYL